MIKKIMCFFGFHDYGHWIFLGCLSDGSTKSARLCRREDCVAVETLHQKMVCK